ncbi:hypothetical protein OY671_012347, partial [Metschnikowia pulcherrima]
RRLQVWERMNEGSLWRIWKVPLDSGFQGGIFHHRAQAAGDQLKTFSVVNVSGGSLSIVLKKLALNSV